jgi:hypothetical protein
MIAPAIYIAGPYTKPNPVLNVHKALDVAEILLVHGFEVYVPHLSHYWEMYHCQHPYEWWMRFDLAWLRRCNAVLRIEGESEGADKEVKYAQDHCLPVFFSIEELLKFYKNIEGSII